MLMLVEHRLRFNPSVLFLFDVMHTGMYSGCVFHAFSLYPRGNKQFKTRRSAIEFTFQELANLNKGKELPHLNNILRDLEWISELFTNAWKYTWEKRLINPNNPITF